jgi:glyoxylase I family protein
VTVEILGIDHIYLAVSDLDVSERFYDPVMELLRFRKTRGALEGEPHVFYSNRLFGFVLRPARSGSPPGDRFSPGMHHLCLRVEGNAEVDRVAAGLTALGIDATEPRLYPQYADDYYATFFSDPDGVRVEVRNFRAERRAHYEEGRT